MNDTIADTETRKPALVTAVAALGVVYGDIGTSPLYAFEQSIGAAGPYRPAAVLGIVSLIFWSLALSVTLKYVVVMMRADNDGEGGILALFALAQRSLHQIGLWPRIVVSLALAGTALFFCDALITPAITVLSAVEGLKLVDPDFSHAVIPVTLLVLVALYGIQRRGPARVGGWFGPIMIVWFVALGVSGALAIVSHPSVLVAINPRYAVWVLLHSPGLSLAIIGAVFLSITGGEALYADMGAFGKSPVRIAWFGLVWPALLLNYFGQGALLLKAGAPVARPMYTLVGPALLPFMLALATAAGVIASQAVISGAFSVAKQAVQLDMLPRIRVLQTSALEHGQIYVPVVNALQFVAVIGFVLGFGSSDALGGAYGAAVVGTMFITTILGAFVAATQWEWPKWRVALLFSLLLGMDLVFVLGNSTKIPQGGWVPLVLAAGVFTIFSVWRSGRLDLRHALAQMAVPLAKLPQVVDNAPRVAGTGVYLASHPGFIPSALIRNLEHNKVLHERCLILNFEILRSPRLSRADRVRIKELMPGIYQVTAYFGFMETADMREALRACRSRGLRVYLEDCSFFIGAHVVVARPRPGWQGLKRRLFARMQRRSASSAEFFRMPAKDVMILNTVVEI
ncbi:MAG TPA: KUP/HAK/KT family potassium transporter [Steroidobacteraceae bacterium]|nr:KUP/HAK/KT family potassium transporter [Steroidobacteraceae bacterium]